MVDLGVVLSDAADQNCFSGNTFSTSAPANIEQVMPCDATGTSDFATGAVDIAQFLDTSGNAKGVGYKESPVPKRQRTMPGAARAKARPAGAPPAVDLADDRRSRRLTGQVTRPAVGGQRWFTRERSAAKHRPKLMRNTTNTARNALPRSSQCQPARASERMPSSR